MFMHFHNMVPLGHFFMFTSRRRRFILKTERWDGQKKSEKCSEAAEMLCLSSPCGLLVFRQDLGIEVCGKHVEMM